MLSLRIFPRGRYTLNTLRFKAGAAIERAGITSHIRLMTENPREPILPSPSSTPEAATPATPKPREIGGPKGPEPTRYGDWEHNGRCTDF